LLCMHGRERDVHTVHTGTLAAWHTEGQRSSAISIRNHICYGCLMLGYALPPCTGALCSGTQ
jgi:hypothetical protein